MNKIKMLLWGEILVFTILTAIVSWLIELNPIGADSRLYIHLAEKMASGEGYHETIRGQVMLPSIGHPLILSIFHYFLGFSFEAITRFLTCSGLLVIGASSFLSVGRIWPAIVVVLSFYRVFDGSHYVAGAESGLILSFSLLALSTIAVMKKTKPSMFLFFSLSICLTLLIRPLLYPLCLVVLPIWIGALFWKKERSSAGALLLVPLFILVMSMISINQEGDRRYLLGTYGSITLLSGFNEHLDLERPYYSITWKLAGNKAVEHREQLISLDEGWQSRDKRLKKYIVNYIWKNPIDALKGYLYRLGRYTIYSKKFLYSATFVIFFLFSMYSLFKWREVTALLPIGLLGYLISFQALFPYSGTRYLTVHFIFMASSLFGLIYLFLKNKKVGV